MHRTTSAVPYPEPYVPRRLTFEIRERIGAEGDVVEPLDEAARARRSERLRAGRVEAVAVCLLWSIVNPEHEQRGRRAARRGAARASPYTLSHRLNPIVREYRRASSTAIDASLKPLMQRASARDRGRPARRRLRRASCFVVTSFGGVLPIDRRGRAADLLASTRARRWRRSPGALYATRELDDARRDRLRHRRHELRRQRRPRRRHHVHARDLARPAVRRPHHRALVGRRASRSAPAAARSPGSTPAACCASGPQSAGAEPGPGLLRARRRASRRSPTRAVVLGYIDPDYFLGGRMRARRRRAAGRRSSEVASALGLDLERGGLRAILARRERAHGRRRSGRSRSTRASIRASVADRRRRRRGGPQRSSRSPRELGCRRVLVPPHGRRALSAVGGLHVGHRHGVRPQPPFVDSDRFDFDAVNEALDGARAADATSSSRALGAGDASARIDYFVEARYPHQVWELEVPLPARPLRGRGRRRALVEELPRRPRARLRGARARPDGRVPVLAGSRCAAVLAEAAAAATATATAPAGRRGRARGLLRRRRPRSTRRSPGRDARARAAARRAGDRRGADDDRRRLPGAARSP